MTLAEAQRHAQSSRRSSRRSISSVGLALGLRVPVAVEGRDERAAPVEVELAHLVGAPEVQVDRAVVDGRGRARGLDRAEQLAAGDVDDGDGVRRGRAQRHAGGRVVLGLAQDEAPAALDAARPRERSSSA